MPKKHQNDPRSGQKDPKRIPRRPKTTPRGAPDDQKTDPERQDEKRTEPRGSWERLGPAQGRFPKSRRAPGGPFERPKRHQNRSQNDQKSKRKIKSKKKRSKTILDPSWGDLGPTWVPSWAKNRQKPWGNVVFREKSLFRC